MVFAKHFTGLRRQLSRYLFIF